MTQDAFIIEAVRTPVGRRRGALAHWHPVDLAATTLHEVVNRTGIDSGEIDDVIMGCVDQVGEQGLNVGRSAALAAGFPETVPGVTEDRQCGSSQQAVQFAAQGVVAGGYDVVIATGVESMTRVPMFANVPNRGEAYGVRFRERYEVDDDALIEQGESAEIIADKWEISREELDAFALRSHQRAAAGIDAGYFRDEIIPVADADGTGLITTDEGIRRGTTLEALAGLDPVFRSDGRLTAGNSSQISDGAAALLIASGAALERLGLQQRARIHTVALAGVDPIEMLSGPIPVTKKVLERSGLKITDVDPFEINEAFASVPLAWLRETGAEGERLNVDGGAIALGHPLGCTGARLMTSLVHELERRGGGFGLQALCEGGGMANAPIVECCE